MNLDVTLDMHSMTDESIRETALAMLNRLLQHCTINMAAKQTKIARTTLYRWIDPELDLDKVTLHTAAWFILMYETRFEIQLILAREPSRRRMAHKIIEAYDDNPEGTETTT